MKKYQFFHESVVKTLKRDGAISVRCEVVPQVRREFEENGILLYCGAMVHDFFGEEGEMRQILYI